jgi:hypothetical protein
MSPVAIQSELLSGGDGTPQANLIGSSLVCAGNYSERQLGGVRGYAVRDKSVGPPGNAASKPHPRRVSKHGLAAVTSFVTRV